MQTLDHTRHPGKPARSAQDVAAAFVALLDRVAVPIDPDVPGGEKEGDRILLIRGPDHPVPDKAGVEVITLAGFARPRAYLLGPFSVRDLIGALGRPDPLGHLSRRFAGAEDALHALVCRRAGATYVALDETTPLAGARRPAPRAIGRLSAARVLVDGVPKTVLAPALGALDGTLRAIGDDRRRVLVTSRRRLTAILHTATAEETERKATRMLLDVAPDLSASRCPTIGQQLGVAAALGLIVGAALDLAGPASIGVFGFTALSFLAQGALRMRAATMFEASRPAVPPALSDADLPSYTVMVAIYREAEIVPRLVEAIAAFDYPRSRLEVLILCEADDAETIAAATAACDGLPDHTVLTVPPGRPRTKPRALVYGLAHARGDVIAVYDAEDRPEPDQLRKAAATLAGGPPDVAVVQARLEITDADCFLQHQFALEYAALFDGYLPWLARARLPLPLGGTSNHFKREALEACGAWDPWNVTEDADVGIRLARFGFSSAVVESTTLEEAPDRVGVWVRQRSRWIKGWLVTWLVHSRDLAALRREVGIRSLLVIQAHMIAVVLSPLCYPLGLALVAGYALGLLPTPGDGSFVVDLLVSSSLLSALYSAAGTVLLIRRVHRRRNRRVPLARYAGIPAYWLLMSAAAWLAVWELFRRPHHWAKTPHAAPPAGPTGQDETSASPVQEGTEDAIGSGINVVRLERVKGIEPSS